MLGEKKTKQRFASTYQFHLPISTENELIQTLKRDIRAIECYLAKEEKGGCSVTYL